ncbi:MAG: hypothetical protein IH895_09160 [Planctomycetes bacterium]|nr:hypothetical protein [Planctomycetota bacterium]
MGKGVFLREQEQGGTPFPVQAFAQRQATGSVFGSDLVVWQTHRDTFVLCLEQWHQTFYNAAVSTFPSVVIPLVGTMALAATACTPHARVTVEQSRAKGRQHRMELQSNWAAFAENGSTRALLAFPLPGARRGDKHFYIYLRCPSATGRFLLAPGGPDDVRGFFKQVTGRHAGVARFIQAAVTIDGDQDTCAGRFEFKCDDGTILQGEFRATRDDWIVQQFEEATGLE